MGFVARGMFNTHSIPVIYSSNKFSENSRNYCDLAAGDGAQSDFPEEMVPNHS